MAPNYYEILQVNPTATPEVIKAAYRALMGQKKMHPDLGGKTDAAQAINEAYEILKDAQKRAAYDTKLRWRQKWSVFNRKKISFEDRRQVPRKPANATVSFCVAHDQRWSPAWILDMSILGLRFQTHAKVVLGQEITMSCPNPVTQAIIGTARWVRLIHSSIFERIYEVGLEFLEPLSDIEQRLGRF